MSWYGDALSAWYRSQQSGSDILAQGIASLGQSIGKGIEDARTNQIANQIGTQEGMGPVTAAANSGAYAPRAALVSPGNVPGTDASNYIPSSVPTEGTAPAHGAYTGGYKGLQLQNAIDSLRNQRANTQSEMALRQAQGEYYGAHTQAITQQAATNAQRANTYQQSVTQKANPADTIKAIHAELNDTYATDAEKNPAPLILGALQQDPNGASFRGDIQKQNGSDVWVPDPNGKIFSPNAPKPTPADSGFLGTGLGGHGVQPQAMTGDEIKVPWSEAQKYLNRYNAATSARAAGGDNQSAAGGGQRLSPQEAAQLPPGTVFTGLDGQQYRVPNAGQ